MFFIFYFLLWLLKLLLCFVLFSYFVRNWFSYMPDTFVHLLQFEGGLLSGITACLYVDLKALTDGMTTSEFYATHQGVLSSAKWHAIADHRLSDCREVVSG